MNKNALFGVGGFALGAFVGWIFAKRHYKKVYDEWLDENVAAECKEMEEYLY